MSAGDISYFRYAQHGGVEQEVGPGDATLPRHHSHYSYLKELTEVNIETLLEERGKTHGDFRENARLMQHLKEVFRSEEGWEKLSVTQRESLDMIALKIGRILTGDATHVDSWQDIAGYAKLGGRSEP